MIILILNTHLVQQIDHNVISKDTFPQSMSKETEAGKQTARQFLRRNWFKTETRTQNEPSKNEFSISEITPKSVGSE